MRRCIQPLPTTFLILNLASGQKNEDQDVILNGECTLGSAPECRPGLEVSNLLAFALCVTALEINMLFRCFAKLRDNLPVLTLFKQSLHYSENVVASSPPGTRSASAIFNF